MTNADKFCTPVTVPQHQCSSVGASTVKEPGHFEVRKSSSQVTWMHFFPQKKLTTFFLVVALKTLTPFHRQNKTKKMIIHGNIFIFRSHY